MPEEVIVYRIQLEGADEAARQLDRLEQRVQRARQGTGGGGAPVTRAVQSSAAAEAVAVNRAAASRSTLFDTFGRSAFGPAVAGLAAGFASIPLQQLTQSALAANSQVGAFDPARARINIERQTALSRFGRSAEGFQQPFDRFGTSLLNAAGPAGGLVAGAAAVGQGVAGAAGIGAIVAGLGAVAAALAANTAATAANTASRGGGALLSGAAGGAGLAGLGLPLAVGAGAVALGAGAPLAAAAYGPPQAPVTGGGIASPVGILQRLLPHGEAIGRALGIGLGNVPSVISGQAPAGPIFGPPLDPAGALAQARIDRATAAPGFSAFDLQRREQALVPPEIQDFEQRQIGRAQGQFQIAGQRRALALQQEGDALSARQLIDRQALERQELVTGVGRAYDAIQLGAGRQAREAGIGLGINRREIGIGAAQQLADIQRSTAISQREIGIGAGETRADIEQGYQRGRRNLILGQIGGLAGGLIGLRTQRRDQLADLEESVGRQQGRLARGAGDAAEGVGIGAGRALAGAERSFADQIGAIARSRTDAEQDLVTLTQQQVADLTKRQTLEQTLFQQASALRTREQTLLKDQLDIQEGLVKKLQPTVADQITAYEKLTTSLNDMSKFMDTELIARGGRPTPPAPSTQATRGAMPNY